jgi:peptide/nickel transport system permease protein
MDKEIRKRMWKKRTIRYGLIMLGVLYLIAALAPVLSPEAPDQQTLGSRLQPPSWDHFLGTDDLGRDVFSRMIHGARISLTVGLIAVTISLTIGLLVGGIAGTFGGWTDHLLMRLVDVMLCIPTLFLIMTLIVMVGPSLFNVMVIIGITSWMDIARMVRAEIMSLKERDFVTAARSLGATDLRLMFRHLIPNALAPVFVSVTFMVGGAILLESSLSFLGLGVQPPTASWGNILTTGKDYLQEAWWLTAFPGLAIFLTVLAFNLVGDGLRDVLDPRLRE